MFIIWCDEVGSWKLEVGSWELGVQPSFRKILFFLKFIRNLTNKDRKSNKIK